MTHPEQAAVELGRLKRPVFELDEETGIYTAETPLGRYRMFVRNVYFRPRSFSADEWNSPIDSTDHGNELVWQDYRRRVAALFETTGGERGV